MGWAAPISIGHQAFNNVDPNLRADLPRSSDGSPQKLGGAWLGEPGLSAVVEERFGWESGEHPIRNWWMFMAFGEDGSYGSSVTLGH